MFDRNGILPNTPDDNTDISPSELYKEHPKGVRAFLISELSLKMSYQDNPMPYYLESMKLEHELSAHNERCRVLEDQGLIDKAKACYEEGIAMCFSFSNAYERLRIIYTREKKFDDAIRVCKAAVEMTDTFRKLDSSRKGDNRMRDEYLEWIVKLEKKQGKVEVIDYDTLYKKYQKRSADIKSSNEYQDFARQFALIDDPRAHDKAWNLFHEAIGLSVTKEHKSPHNIRRDMAKLLISEGKPAQAVQTLLIAIAELKMFGESMPKVLETDLRKAIREDGINLRLQNYRELPQSLIQLAQDKGHGVATKYYQEWKQAERRPDKQDIESTTTLIEESSKVDTPEVKKPSFFNKILRLFSNKENADE